MPPTRNPGRTGAEPFEATAAGSVRRALTPRLRVRGFFARGDGFFRPTGAGCQVIRVSAAPLGGAARAAVTVTLEVRPVLDVLAGSARGAGAERSLWDLVPGRERGMGWRVTPQTALDAVGADVANQLERYGLSALDQMNLAD